jgi:cytochrome c peroxidase
VVRAAAGLLFSFAVLAGCGAPPFTAHERAQLEALTLKQVPPSPTNRVADDPRAAVLGQQFFWDTRLSGPLLIGDDGVNGGLGPKGQPQLVSCASCHEPGQGGADIRTRGATSLGAGWTGRNAPTVINAVRGGPWMFWDGRKDSVWSQALQPFENPVEHNTSRLEMAHLVFDRYRAPYEALFGAMPDLSALPPRGKPGDAAFDGLTAAEQRAVDTIFANIGKAIEAYERKLVDSSSPFDRFMAGDTSAMPAAAIRGAQLFVGKAACDECHSGQALSDWRFHNHAIPQVGETVQRLDRGRTDGVPQVIADPFNALGPYSDAPATWLDGLEAGAHDLGAFRTPTLRNTTKTAPYMHTGSFKTLWDVMVWYRDAAGTDGFVGERDVAVKPLALDNDDLFDLVAFLYALEGDPLPEELLRAPVMP